MRAQFATRFIKQYRREWKQQIAPAPHHPHPADWPETGLHAAWIGHSTVLIKANGIHILTDPVFSIRAGLNLGPVTLGVKRLVAPALSLRELPLIDAIVLSHAHMDHFDLPSLRLLRNRSTEVFTATQTSDLLRASRYRAVHEVSWGQTVQTEKLSVTAFPVNHWGARVQRDTYRGFNGYVIQAGEFRILFGGDTAWTTSFRDLQTAGGIHFGIMPIGAYNPWLRFHCTPEQAWEMGNDARCEFLMPVHHQTFQLSREPYFEPVERFRAAAGAAQNRVVADAIGAEFHL